MSNFAFRFRFYFKRIIYVSTHKKLSQFSLSFSHLVHILCLSLYPLIFLSPVLTLSVFVLVSFTSSCLYFCRRYISIFCHRLPTFALFCALKKSSSIFLHLSLSLVCTIKYSTCVFFVLLCVCLFVLSGLLYLFCFLLSSS